MKNFAMTGVAGYIAPRHLQAINDTNNNLITSYDPADNVGKLDSYFPESKFYSFFEQFANEVSKNKIDYLSICTPNYFHKPQIEWGLRNGLDVICEKPLVLNTEDLDELVALEKETGKKVYTVLQLRVHKSIIELKKKIESSPKDKIFNVDLCYFTSRGQWYHQTWKANNQQSGGLPSNIGIHFFDMLTWLFGEAKSNEIHSKSETHFCGYLELERAKVRWVLSIDKNKLPPQANGKTTYRSITIEGEEVEFSGGFTELHTIVYKDILDGKGYGLADARTAIEIVQKMRELPSIGINENSHPLAKNF